MLEIDLKELNAMEIGIYNYILQNFDKIPYMTIRELSDEVHVSTASILRFVRKFGVDGFTEFKGILKNSKNNTRVSFHEKVDALEELYERTLQTDLREKIQEGSELIKDYKHILFFGTGSSTFLAAYGANYMANFGKISFSVDNYYYPITVDNMEDTLVIILSVSGETESCLRLGRMIKERGGKVITITNAKNSSLAMISDLSLAYYTTKESLYNERDLGLTYRDITSQLPVLYIIESLAKGLR